MSTQISTWSASSVNLFDPNRGGCNRKWWFERVAKIPRATHPAAVNGQRIHKVLEDLYAGELTEIPSVLKPAFDRGHLPMPPAPQVQVEFDFRSLGDRFKIGEWNGNGRIDLLIREPGMPVVLDLKTSASYRYSATEETLARDTQAILYSAVAQEVTGETHSRFGHVQVLTTVRPDSRLVMVDMPRQHVIDQLQGVIAPTVLAMQAAEKVLTVSDLPANRAACQAYGGCPFLTQCAAATAAYHFNNPLTPDNNQEDIMPIETTPTAPSVSDALARFRARTPAAPTPAAPPAPTQPVLSREDEDEILLGSIGNATKAAAPAPAPMAALPPKKVAPPAPPAPVQPARPPAPAPVSEPVKKDSSGVELVIYVNCRPDSGAVDMNVVLLPLRQKVADAFKVGHWSLAEFGKGAASVAALLDHELAHGKVSGEVWMSLADPGMREALQVMSHRATKIVRGMP